MIWTYILPPLVGGVIGYVTNDIAIRMLFRPHTAKYIMGWRVPFTPGIIPKEKGRIAEAVGTAISDNLMSKEVLEKYLLSDSMVNRVRASIEEFIAKQKVNEESVSSIPGTLSFACGVDDVGRQCERRLNPADAR